LAVTNASIAEYEKGINVAATPKGYFEVFSQLSVNKLDGTTKGQKSEGGGVGLSTSSGQAASTGSGQAIRRIIPDDADPAGAGNYFEGVFSRVSRRWRGGSGM
jgi:hypothetical protein